MPLPSYSPVIAALGWALLHSIWQAMVIYACLRILLKCLKRAPAAIRYNLSGIAMTGIGAWFLLTFRRQWIMQLREQHVRETILSAVPSLPVPALAPVDDTGNGLAFVWPQIEQYFPYLVALYVMGLFFCCLRVSREWWALRSIRSSRLRSFDPAWEHHLVRLARRLHVYKPVRLFLSDRVDVPLMIGHLKPAVYLPLALVNNLTPEQIEAILLHELAHIKRHDYLLNIFQTVVETVLFFNPFVWWISKNIRRERENACDDMVVATAAPLTYAHALVALEEYRINAHFLAMAATNDRRQLFHRIKRMMEMKTKNLNVTQRLAALLILAGSIASIAWLAPGKKTEPLPEEKTVRSVPLPESFQTAILADTTIIDTATTPSETSSADSRQSSKPVQSNTQKPVYVEKDLANDEDQERLKELNEELAAEISKAQAKAVLASFKVDSIMRQTDWQKVREEAQRAVAKAQAQLAALNWEKMKVDMELARRQADSALRNVDWDQMKLNIALAQRQADSAIRSVDWEKMKRETGLAMARARKDMVQAGKDITMARQSWNHPMIYNSGGGISSDMLVNELSIQGLLNDKGNYTIELNKKGLYINGKKQSDAVYKRYQARMGDLTSMKIKKKNGKTSINMETSK